MVRKKEVAVEETGEVVTEEVPAVEVAEEAFVAGKRKDYELAIAQIEKSFGKGSVMSLGSYNDANPVAHISTGSLTLDMILGKGGFPFGRIVEIYGPESCGKTTLLLSLIARAQALGIKSLFVDAEQSLNVEYAKSVGVNLKTLDISQPDSAEEALTIIETMAASGYVGLICLDSIAAMTPQGEKEKDMTDNAKMAERAALLSRFLPRIIPHLRKNKCLLLCTNQLRTTGIGTYVVKDETPGGKAMKYYATQRVNMKMVEKLKSPGSDEPTGQKVRAKTDKNKMNAPYKECFFNITYGEGIDGTLDLIEVATQFGILEKKGTWFAYNEKNIGQGPLQVKEALRANPELEKEIRDKTLAIVGPEWGPEGRL